MSSPSSFPIFFFLGTLVVKGEEEEGAEGAEGPEGAEGGN